GHEINTGHSEVTKPDACRPVALLADGTMDGCFTGSACWGTYLHGILDNPDVRDYLAKEYATGTQEKIPDYNSYKETQYDKLADLVRRHVDLPAIYRDLLE
ncbi:MAG: cobyric acid synthase, partial [Tannerellaceae bacterium]|nr:cobyric acid synthase [Tannerellaceae bacterium]